MNAVAAAGEIRRILVGLDGSTHSQHALDVAVRLAKWHDAELEGLYVEDIDLVRLATLGVGHEIGPTSPLPRHIEPERLARRLSRGAAEAKRALADTADRDGIRWVFRVERGNVTAAILHAAGSVDIVALGRAGTGRPGPGRLGSTAVALTDQLPRSLIVVQAPVTVGQTVVTVFDGSPSCDRAVETAARLLCPTERSTRDPGDGAARHRGGTRHVPAGRERRHRHQRSRRGDLHSRGAK